MLWSDHDFEQYTQFIVRNNRHVYSHEQQRDEEKRYLLIIIFFPPFHPSFFQKRRPTWTTNNHGSNISFIFVCCPDLTCTWFVWTWLTPLVYFIYLFSFFSISSLVNFFSFTNTFLGGCCYRYSNVNKINKKRNKRFFCSVVFGI